MPNTIRAFFLVAFLHVPCLPFAQAQKKPFEPKFWKDAPDQASVVSATFIGGKGLEWLVSGGFAPDGSIVLVGNIAGPVLDLPVPVKLIGTDLPAPPITQPVPVLDNKGKPQLDKQGNPQVQKPSWRHDGITAFVVRCTKDLKSITSAHRLPWTSGAATTAAVDKDGSIYVAGRATDGLKNLGGDQQELPVAEAALAKEGRCQHTFLAKLTPDGTKAVWVRTFRGFSDAPHVSVLKDGAIRLAAQDVRTFNAASKLLGTINVPGGVKKTTSVSPTDNSIVTSGEHHWPTGREPLRCATLDIHEPDGALKYKLFDWGGPYPGLDNLRLVSDSAIRLTTHDAEGNILFYAWSDGGNSVMTREPTDIRKSVDPKGLGITAAGAGVLSAAYLIRVEPKDYKVIGWTIWLGFTGPNKPNSVWIDNLAQGPDGAILASGRAALGLWQTNNKLSSADPTGEYVAVFDPTLSRVWFCSIVPGAGTAEVSYDKAGWGIVSGIVEGQQKVLFVGGANAGDKAGDPRFATPTANAVQTKFGGGASDGYAILLDLSKTAPVEPAAIVSNDIQPGPTSASFEKNASGKGGKNPPLPPADGTTFYFKPDAPKWFTVDAEFRDRARIFWPTFLYGKPLDGKAVLTGNHLDGTVSVATTLACQPKGDQSRRLLGELYQGETVPTCKFLLQSLGQPKTAEFETTDNKGKSQKKIVEYVDGKGTLEIGDNKISVSPKVTYKFGKSPGVYHGPGKTDEASESLSVSAYITLTAGQLGLKKIAPTTEIDVRITMSGHGAAPSGAKK